MFRNKCDLRVGSLSVIASLRNYWDMVQGSLEVLRTFHEEESNYNNVTCISLENIKSEIVSNNYCGDMRVIKIFFCCLFVVFH